MSLLNILMGVVAGIAIEAAFSHGLVGFGRRPRDVARIAFAGAAVAAAAGAAAVVAMYSAHTAPAHAAAMKWLLYPASAGWTVAVVWLVALYTGVRPRRWLLALTAGFCAVVVVNFALPLGLLHDSVGELHPLQMAGTHVMGIAGTSPHPLNLITVALTAASFVFLFYAVHKVYRRGERRKSAYLAAAAAAFAVTMLLDNLTDYGVISSFYSTQVFLAGVVLATSLGLRNESLRNEAELRAYRTELESLVEARVADLDRANAQLADEVRVRLVAEDALRARVAELDALQHLSQTLAKRADLAAALDQASVEIGTLLRARSVKVHLVRDEASGDAAGSPVEAGSSTIPVAGPSRWDSHLVRDVMDRRQAIVVADPAHAQLPPDLTAVDATGEVRELLLVPMVARAEVVGLLSMAREVDDPPFSSSESRVAQTVADALAVTVENEWLHQRETREAAARERQHLARELHDAVTQSIYSATLIAEALPEVWEREPAEGRRNLETLRRLVHGALAEMRTLLFELRPGALRAAPIDTLLERLGVALSGQIQIPVDVSVQADVILPADVKVTLYRVAQEALSNVAKHARASRVTVSLTADVDSVALRVRDDGRGFDAASVAPERMGLRIMRERMERIGATIAVESAPGRGTSVVVVWSRAESDTPPQGKEGGHELLGSHTRDDRR